MEYERREGKEEQRGGEVLLLDLDWEEYLAETDKVVGYRATPKKKAKVNASTLLQHKPRTRVARPFMSYSSPKSPCK